MADGQVELQMLSRFLPKGMFGILYWYVLYPFHQWIFYGMLKAIAKSIDKTDCSGPERFTPKLPLLCAAAGKKVKKLPRHQLKHDKLNDRNEHKESYVHSTDSHTDI